MSEVNWPKQFTLTDNEYRELLKLHAKFSDKTVHCHTLTDNEYHELIKLHAKFSVNLNTVILIILAYTSHQSIALEDTHSIVLYVKASDISWISE